jgi:hypothetical protein
LITADTPSELTRPPTLLSIARAARAVGDHELERAAVRLLREEYGIVVRFSEPIVCGSSLAGTDRQPIGGRP